uniref:Peptidase S8/S53 domain-containing protein n=1 Tax=Compsopogon caeruleus TaxID=31354 RepID=A0A7S1XGG8_9RHOD|mmetsp:Transcript_6930/g.14331  ORF Transcript_6930/g.14331 Transcript_6930/m.14331 type:complete len:894 (+) Transcript_6930:481-3162(+)|eukprot:CAMPEP_0184683164 /NCGR_PEP_ID=MMETSP0312-20130426/10132_1 /TAXON_ID=31354 /ORGANISM="Compsopogon coeruleus, Strain SAG 36.94" /LENGTH=893 /DNA_ID=CAMNT_0027135283 /DNA_START=394 /DNA_END=3075 /DNA_ORIENTATION=-
MVVQGDTRVPQANRLRLLSLVLIVAIYRVDAVAQLTNISIGQVVDGSTTGQDNNIFTDLDNHNFGGQVVYSFRVRAGETLNAVITTCSNKTNFDSAIYLLLDNPFEVVPYPETSVLNWNDYDSECFQRLSNSNGATVEVELQGEQPNGTAFYVVVTSVGDPSPEEGTYSLNLSQVPSTTIGIQSLWGLDRVDQRNLPLDNRGVAFDGAGSRAWIYVLDTGVRPTHEQLVSRVLTGPSFVGSSGAPVERAKGAEDCNGHGTHVAAIAAGIETGVAQGASVIDVQVLDCTKSGAREDVDAGLQWVLSDVIESNRSPAVVLLSFSGNDSFYDIDGNVTQLLDADIPVVVAAGNQGAEACKTSPASVPGVIVVGSLTQGNDEITSFSNRGDCVSVYSPGERILSSWYLGDSSYRSENGTSQSAAFVAGAVASMLSDNPSLTPPQVLNTLISVATISSLTGIRVLYVRTGISNPSVVPPVGSVDIHFVLRVLNLNSCKEEVIRMLQESAASALALSTNVINTTDCSTIPRPDDTNSTLADAVVEFIIRIAVRDGAKAFGQVENSLLNGTFLNALATPFNVTQAPWAVDSRGYVYWASPNFESLVQELSSEINLVAVLLGVLAGLLVLVVFIVVVFRHLKRRRIARKQAGNHNPPKSTVRTFDDHPETPKNLGSGSGNHGVHVASRLLPDIPESPSGFGVRVASIGGEAFVSAIQGMTSNESPFPARHTHGRALTVSSDPSGLVGISGGVGPSDEMVNVESLGGQAMAVSSNVPLGSASLALAVNGEPNLLTPSGVSGVAVSSSSREQRMGPLGRSGSGSEDSASPTSRDSGELSGNNIGGSSVLGMGEDLDSGVRSSRGSLDRRASEVGSLAVRTPSNPSRTEWPYGSEVLFVPNDPR